MTFFILWHRPLVQRDTHDGPFARYYYDTIRKRYEKIREEEAETQVRDNRIPTSLQEPTPDLEQLYSEAKAFESYRNLSKRLGQIDSLAAELEAFKNELAKERYEATRRAILAEALKLRQRAEALRQILDDEELLLTLMM